MKCIQVTATSGLDQAAAEGKLHPSGYVLFEMKVKKPSVRQEQLGLFGESLCSRARRAKCGFRRANSIIKAIGQ